MKITAEDIVEPLRELIDAKKLLDKILVYYDIYSGQFREIPDYEAEYMWKRPDGTYITDSLNKQIREYEKFDDSE